MSLPSFVCRGVNSKVNSHGCSEKLKKITHQKNIIKSETIFNFYIGLDYDNANIKDHGL